MGRLIDADKFEAFVIRTNGDEEFVNGVQYVLERIDKAPTVDAIPRERIDQMVMEILELDTMGVSYQPFINKNDVLVIIHKYTKEQTEC